MTEIYTIGHSTHTTDRFIELLLMHEISAVCDVRSHPYSRFNPQFNREVLQEELKRNGIAYVYLGKELGPISDDPQWFYQFIHNIYPPITIRETAFLLLTSSKV